MSRRKSNDFLKLVLGAALGLGAPGAATAQQVFASDVIVQGSLCVGVDCANNQSFGSDVIRLKEDTLRIGFNDTSTAAGFPANDWELTINDSANGGLDRFSITDITGGTTPFTVEAGARANAIYAKDQFVGFGTSLPAEELHVMSANTPTLRLEQDGSGGLFPWVWDIIANSGNFLVADRTGGTLPFKIVPYAPTNALVIAGTTGDIGLGTLQPENEIHIADSGNIGILFDSTDTNQAMRLSLNDGGAGNGLDEFRVVFVGKGKAMRLTENGDMTILGSLITSGGGGACTAADPCDAVFDPEAFTPPTIEEHAAAMWREKRLPALDPIGPDRPLNMTTTMLRMLQELELAHVYVAQLNARLVQLESQGNVTAVE